MKKSILTRCSFLVGLSGLEPPTSRLSGVRSNQLSYRPVMERVMRIELTTSAWKAEVLPLNYTRIYKLKIFPGREDRIRTCDPLVPNQVLYQAELLPVLWRAREESNP
jgi:hypothetical protein